MKIYQYGFFAIALLITTGCTVSAPGVKVKTQLPGLEVQVDAGGNGHGCPPGLAKQGRC